MLSVLIDTNLLLLLIVGLYDKKLISVHRRTRNFLPEDFDLLVESINGYKILWVTSHCLAEVSNLIRHTHEDQAEKLMACFSSFVAKAKESHIPKEIIFKNDISTMIGVTDTGLIIKSKRVSCVFTADLELYLEILRRGYKAVNFNNLRTEKFIA